MPDPCVKTIRELIWTRYATISARGVPATEHGRRLKKDGDGWVRRMLEDLRSGVKDWSELTRNDSLLAETERTCAYCGDAKDLVHDPIVPSSLAINEDCPECDTIQTIHNQVWTCPSCRSAKGTMGLYQFYRRRRPGDNRFHENIPSRIEKKYLHVAYKCLNCAKCLDCGDLDGDGKLTVLDIDFALQQKGRLWNVLL